jgi:molybdenum cofactor biosynthesis enzyme MoaA
MNKIKEFLFRRMINNNLKKVSIEPMFILTEYCNLGCDYCFNYSGQFRSKQTIPPEDIEYYMGAFSNDKRF